MRSIFYSNLWKTDFHYLNSFKGWGQSHKQQSQSFKAWILKFYIYFNYSYFLYFQYCDSYQFVTSGWNNESWNVLIKGMMNNDTSLLIFCAIHVLFYSDKLNTNKFAAYRFLKHEGGRCLNLCQLTFYLTFIIVLNCKNNTPKLNLH